MVRRSNTDIDMFNTGTALLDVGSGITIPLPVSGVFTGIQGPAGPAGPYTPAVAMPNAQDLNTYVTTGNWNVHTNGATTGGANYPVNYSGMLSVVARSDGAAVIQRYRTYGGAEPRRIYYRSLYAGVWSAWEIVAYDSGQFPAYAKNRDFGAKGDGTADDTVALQAWLNSPNKDKVLPDGIYRITANLTCAIAGAKISGPGTIKVDTVGVDALNITAADVTVTGIEIDGNSKGRYLVYSTGAGTIVERCRLHDAYSTTNSPRGVFISTPGGGTVRHNRIWNITAVGNATLGDGNGFARGVVLHSTTAPTAPYFCHDNIIENILGEEGDGIASLFSDGTTTLYSMLATVTITDNLITNVSRRFIKTQGSSATISDNILRHNGTVPAFPSSAIDVIYGNDITITGNEINAHPLTSSIAVNGESGTNLVKNLVIRDNVIKQADDKPNSGIYCKWVKFSTISGNTVYGGTNAVLIGSCENSVVAGNTHFGGDPAFVSFSANNSNTDITMKYNINANPARAVATLNDGTGAVN